MTTADLRALTTVQVADVYKAGRRAATLSRTPEGVELLDDLIDRSSGLEERLRDGAIPFGQKTIADFTAELRFRRPQALG